MSLCRWSSMAWRCDLYVYEAAEGWAVHVASNRRVGPIPNIDWDALMAGNLDAFGRSHEIEQMALDSSPLAPIGGPFDGESWYGLDDDELHDRLTILDEAGYVFPDDLAAALDGEDE